MSNLIAADRQRLADMLADVELNGAPIKVYPYWPESFLNPPFILIAPDDPFLDSGQTFRSASIGWRITAVLSGINEGLADRNIEQLVEQLVLTLIANGWPVSSVGRPGLFSEGTNQKLVAVQLSTHHTIKLQGA